MVPRGRGCLLELHVFAALIPQSANETGASAPVFLCSPAWSVCSRWNCRHLRVVCMSALMAVGATGRTLPAFPWRCRCKFNRATRVRWRFSALTNDASWGAGEISLGVTFRVVTARFPARAGYSSIRTESGILPCAIKAMARRPAIRSGRMKRKRAPQRPFWLLPGSPYFPASFFIASRMALFGSSSAVEPDWPGCGVS